MAEQIAAKLDALRELVQNAKGVPMSASCMLNRAEVVALIEDAKVALERELAEATKIAEASQVTLDRARQEAGQIVASAQQRADYLASQDAVAQRARQKAGELERRSVEEAEALRREADAYVDGRIAGLEAGLQKTLTQIKTMRARLATRSGLDAEETTTLSRLT